MKNQMTTKKFFSVISATAGLFVSVLAIPEAQACRMSRDAKSNYFINLDSGKVGMFGTGEVQVIAPTVIERCQPSAGKYLMLTLGLRTQGLVSDVSDISFDGRLAQDNCSISNSLLAQEQTFAEKKGYFEQQFKLLRTCTQMQITELEGKRLDFKTDQVQCKMTIKDGVITAEGNYCFIRIQPNNRISVATIIKPECTKPEFLKAHGLNPMDLEALFNAYVVGDDSGNSSDVDPLGSSRIRLSVSPMAASGIPLSDDFEGQQPKFPTDYTPDIHMGNVNFRPIGENRVSADLSLLVDTRTKKSCSDGLCTSAGDYNTPVVGEVELFQVDSSKRSFIQSWWFAGIAQSRWQGLLRGIQQNIDEVTFKPGQKYQLDVTFVDPYDDYDMFISGMKQLVIDLKQVQGTAGLDVITPIASLQSLIGLPIVGGLPGIKSADLNLDDEVKRILAALKALTQERQWPIYYHQICDSSVSTCIRSGKAKYFLKVSTEFELGALNDENIFTLKNIKVKKDSPRFASYSKTVSELPSVKCDTTK